MNSCETQCSKFEAHRSFLQILDHRICFLLGLRVLSELDIQAPKDTSKPGQGLCDDHRAVAHLGLKIVLYSGAFSLLLKDDKDKEKNGDLLSTFAFEVDASTFSSSTTKYTAFFFPETTTLLAHPEDETAVMVVRDYTRDTTPRFLSWDVLDITLEEDYEFQMRKEFEQDPEKKNRLILTNYAHLIHEFRCKANLV